MLLVVPLGIRLPLEVPLGHMLAPTEKERHSRGPLEDLGCVQEERCTLGEVLASAAPRMRVAAFRLAKPVAERKFLSPRPLP
ncbi:hypothetical protein NDU88_005735 [Pleurodeles waltl]|uniref:Uncharacterized protein n=1 Tax=Pleurodeles waltl TaxID=8319 RepID=A0AAV7UKU5_PLEWA|nr:hypothetical protein NDU88_005735 [Pleurodeles waltl]